LLPLGVRLFVAVVYLEQYVQLFSHTHISCILKAITLLGVLRRVDWSVPTDVSRDRGPFIFRIL
jgi:hypothetical protein